MTKNKSKRDYGTGSVYYSESRKSWCAQYKVGVNSNGSAKKKTIYGKTKKEVKSKLAKIQSEILIGTYIEPSKTTLVQLAIQNAKNKKAANLIADTTYKRTLDTIQKIENSALSNIPVQKITEQMIVDFLNSLTYYSNSVLKKVYMTIKSAFNTAIKLGIININPMNYIICPKSIKPTKKIRALTIEEEQKVLAALNQDSKEPYRTMLILSLFTGMRMGEICALEYDKKIIKEKVIIVKRTITKDINDKFILGKTTKTYAGTRTIKLNNDIINLLNTYIKNYYHSNDLNLLFVDKKNNLVTTNQINSYYCRLIERYNIAPVKECNQHQLRHTFATRCIESGMPAKVLQHILGHKEISTTLDTYTDVFDEFENTYTDLTQKYLINNNIII